MHMMQALSKSAFWVVYRQLGVGFVRICLIFTSAVKIALWQVSIRMYIYIYYIDIMLVSVNVTCF